MPHFLHPRPRDWIWTPLAETGDRFVDFAPYVPSINERGLVAFQAALRAGGSGVFIAGDPEQPPASSVIGPSSSSTIADIISHPDIDDAGRCCFYGTQPDGATGVFLALDGNAARIALHSGPLGPTIAGNGQVAFRTNLPDGRTGISRCCAAGGPCIPVARSGGGFTAFHGLPIINSAGNILFRADDESGRQGIHLDGPPTRPIFLTGDLFTSLAAFPHMNDAGTIVFAASRRSGGGSGIFAVSPAGEVECVIDSSAGFESFRGALIDGAGRVVFFATPRAGTLGIFTGADSDRERLLWLGAPLFGSTVEDFALNPVSINAAGQLAARVKLADQRQLVLRMDSVAP